MNSGVSQAVPGHGRAQSPANPPGAAVTPAARGGGSGLPPPGLASRDAEQDVSFNSGGLGDQVYTPFEILAACANSLHWVV